MKCLLFLHIYLIKARWCFDFSFMILIYMIYVFLVYNMQYDSFECSILMMDTVQYRA